DDFSPTIGIAADLLNQGSPSITNPDGSRSNIGVYGGLYSWSADSYTTTPYYVTTGDGAQLDTSAWTSLSGVTFTQTTPTSTSLKYLVSFDGRTTWKYWDGSAWQSSSLANIGSNGNDKAT